MFPHFLGIGVQKSGTTWLHHNLKPHPDIWMSPVKEIRYFDMRRKKPSFFKFDKQLRRKRVREAYRDIRKRTNVGWWVRYLFFPCNDKWYASLFTPNQGQIAGDITPALAYYDRDTVARIHALMPNAKTIVLLRNPIDRAWSHFNMHMRYNNFPQKKHLDNATIHEFMHRGEVHKRADYARLLDNWYAFYPPEQVFVGFYEHLITDPAQLILDVYRFLGVDSSPDRVPEAVSKNRVAAKHGTYPAIPEKWGCFLAARYHESLIDLHLRFGNDSTASWLESARKYLQAK